MIGTGDILAVAMPLLLLVGGAIGWFAKRQLTSAKDREEAQHLSTIAQTLAQMRASNVTLKEIEDFRAFIGRGRRRETRRPAVSEVEALETLQVGEHETQAEMNEAASRELDARDAEMNSLIDQLAALLSRQEFARLRDAQQKWMTFRDAHAEFVSDLFAGGSMRPLWYITSVMSATNDRIDELRAYLEVRNEDL